MRPATVNVFVVGAPKAGTTTLYQHFLSHPEIDILSVKEPHFFGEYRSEHGPRYDTLEDYRRLFPTPGKSGATWLADFSTSYLYSRRAAAEISAYNPDARIIALLRNPVERSISMYFHQRKSLLEPLDLESALAIEAERIRTGWGFGYHYTAASLYHDQVSRYLDIFGERFKICFFEDLVRNPAAVLEEIQAFLGLAAPFPPRQIHLNRTGEPKNVLLQELISREYPGKALLRKLLGRKLIDRIIALNVGEKTAVDQRIKTELAQFFEMDIRRLEALLGRPTGWLR